VTRSIAPPAGLLLAGGVSLLLGLHAAPLPLPVAAPLRSEPDEYVPGVEALGRSLDASGTRAAKVLMVTPEISKPTRGKLAGEGWIIREIAPVENPHPATAQLFPRFAGTFAKLRAWDLTEIEKLVLLDADTIVLRSVDELFDRVDQGVFGCLVSTISASELLVRPYRIHPAAAAVAPLQRRSRRDRSRTGGAADHAGGR